jgi:molybdopterin-guanine dinucleotide biosynthesis protein A
MRELCSDVPTVHVADPDDLALDVDTPADLDRARGRAEGGADDPTESGS